MKGEIDLLYGHFSKLDPADIGPTLPSIIDDKSFVKAASLTASVQL